MAKIIIPTPLRKFAENTAQLEINGGTVIESVQELARKYPDLSQHLFDAEGKIRQFIRIYVGDEDINALDKEETKVEEQTIISIIPAIAGGVSDEIQCSNVN